MLLRQQLIFTGYLLKRVSSPNCAFSLLFLLLRGWWRTLKSFTKWRIVSAGGHESAKVSSVVKFSLYQSYTIHYALPGRTPTYVIDPRQPDTIMPSLHSVLQSATTDSLFVPHIRLLFGQWAVPVVAPDAWNQLQVACNVHCDKYTNTFKEKKLFYSQSFIFVNLFYYCFYWTACVVQYTNRLQYFINWMHFGKMNSITVDLRSL